MNLGCDGPSDRTTVASSDFMTFGGPLIKAEPDFETPSKIVISWYNFVEGDNVRDGTAFWYVGQGAADIKVTALPAL